MFCSHSEAYIKGPLYQGNTEFSIQLTFSLSPTPLGPVGSWVFGVCVWVCANGESCTHKRATLSGYNALTDRNLTQEQIFVLANCAGGICLGQLCRRRHQSSRRTAVSSLRMPNWRRPRVRQALMSLSWDVVAHQESHQAIQKRIHCIIGKVSIWQVPLNRDGRHTNPESADPLVGV